MQEPMDIDQPAPVRPALQKPSRTVVRSSSVPAPSTNSRDEEKRRGTGYVYDSAMMLHRHPTEDHPEMPNRICTILHEMRLHQLTERMISLFFVPVKRHHAMLVHSEDHWDKVEQLAHMSKEDILNTVPYYEGLSLYVSPDTTAAAKLSCGGVIEACRAVVKGDVRNSFAIVRPPGHHAEPDEHMGFCFFNNVAVAARVMQEELGVKRVLILDWDVHHGNGTQKAFIDDPSVLYMSIHRYDNGSFYPGGHFGAPTSCGEGKGLGYSVNVAWPQGGMGDAEYLYAFQRIIMPIAIEFAPELVIISAGFDAARGDDLGECEVTPTGYAHMTHMLSSLAGGKVVVALEGGYNLISIRESSAAVMRVLLGETPPALPSMTANRLATETVFQAARIQTQYWSNIKAPPFEPSSHEGAPTINLPVLLKKYRARHMFDQHKLYQMPISDMSLHEAFSGLALCSPDIFAAKTLILFIHNFGDLHAELLGETVCDVDMEKSYIMDASDEIVKWARDSNYSFIDLNVFPNPRAATESKDIMREMIVHKRRLITYVWDNYVELLEDASVYLIAYGGASFPISELFRAREAHKHLKGVAQIIGEGHYPAFIRQQSDVYDWFVKNSVVYAGLDPVGTNALKQQKGLGRIEVISSTAQRGTVVMKECVPLLDELIKSGRLFGDQSPNATLLPSSTFVNGVSPHVFSSLI